jgi:arabinofuranan 3-O-arabinosyltransferase
MALFACGDPVTLPSGSHQVTLEGNGFFAGDALTFTNTQPRPTTASSTIRAVKVDESDETSTVAHIGPGGASYLTLGESYNDGWNATLDGHRLEPVRLGGWEQAWIVPGGAGGVVHMSYTPDRWFRRALLVGGLLIAALALLAVFSDRGRQVSPPASDSSWPRRRLGWDVGIRYDVAIVVAVAIGGLLGGWVGALIPLPLLAFETRRALPWIAAATFVAAGVVAALSPAEIGSDTIGAIGRPAHLLGVASVCAVVLALGTRPPRQRRNAQPTGTAARQA